jgi:hypothetical protein
MMVVEKAALRPRAPAVFNLPLPGSAGGEGWRDAARDGILSRGVRPFVGPVEVRLTFRDGRRRRSMGDLPNQCLQLLVCTRTISAADSAVLRRLVLAWGAVEGLRIEIAPADGNGP